ncbi:hypothetical protein FRC02_008681 [Tulasnella sp. 418]|nr:hypothetical protein FRC02_008681 [Tulasnella sp. 418]
MQLALVWAFPVELLLLVRSCIIDSTYTFRSRTLISMYALHQDNIFKPLLTTVLQDVSLACLYVSTKMHDTLKKPREILMNSYAIRFPELAAKVKVAGGEVEMDPNVQNADKNRMAAIERLVLETICFNFQVQLPFSFVIKLGRDLGASKDLIKLAWRLAIDSHRTLVSIQYPPHTIALACIYLAALLTSFEASSSPAQPTSPSSETGMTPQSISSSLSDHGPWEEKYHSHVEDLEDICHSLLDLLLSFSSNTSHSSLSYFQSPTTPTSPSPHPSPNPNSSGLQAAGGGRGVMQSSAKLTQLKISLREKEHEPRVRLPLSKTDPSIGISAAGVNGLAAEAEGIGRNEGTTRFLFGPGGE